MEIKDMLGDVFTIIGILIGVALVGTQISTNLPPPTGLLFTTTCAAGGFEFNAMWLSIFLTLWFIAIALFSALYGRRNFEKNTNPITQSPPTKLLRLIVLYAYTFTVLAIVTTCVSIFFMFELKYKKFACQPRAFLYTLPSIAITVVTGCGVILHQAWQSLYSLEQYDLPVVVGPAENSGLQMSSQNTVVF